MGKKHEDLAIVAVLAVVYFGAAKLGLRFAFVNPSATALWAPTGITLAAFLIFGIRVWPGAFLGAFFANLTTAGTVLTSITIATRKHTRRCGWLLPGNPLCPWPTGV